MSRHAVLVTNTRADLDCALRWDAKRQQKLGTTGSNFSSQKGARVGLQWKELLAKCSSKLLHLFALHWAAKLVKWCKSMGVIFQLPPNSYIILPPRCKTSYQDVRVGGSICLLPTPHSHIILPPLAAQLLHHFTPSQQVTPSLLHHFSPLGSANLTLFCPHTQRLPFLNPQPLHLQLILLNFWTINACPTLDGLYIWKKNVKITSLWKITPSILHHFTPLGSPILT